MQKCKKKNVRVQVEYSHDFLRDRTSFLPGSTVPTLQLSGLLPSKDTGIEHSSGLSSGIHIFTDPYLIIKFNISQKNLVILDSSYDQVLKLIIEARIDLINKLGCNQPIVLDLGHSHFQITIP